MTETTDPGSSKDAQMAFFGEFTQQHPVVYTSESLLPAGIQPHAVFNFAYTETCKQLEAQHEKIPLGAPFFIAFGTDSGSRYYGVVYAFPKAGYHLAPLLMYLPPTLSQLTEQDLEARLYLPKEILACWTYQIPLADLPSFLPPHELDMYKILSIYEEMLYYGEEAISETPIKPGRLNSVINACALRFLKLTGRGRATNDPYLLLVIGTQMVTYYTRVSMEQQDNRSILKRDAVLSTTGSEMKILTPEEIRKTPVWPDVVSGISVPWSARPRSRRS